MIRHVALAVAAVAAVARPAAAYRPFDETDGDVAETGTIELELGPLQAERTSSGANVGTPTGVFNYGFADGYELVVDFDGTIPLAHASDGRLASDVLVKHVLREGVLQDKPGPSIALEAGALLPTVPQLDDEGGFSADLIISNRIGPLVTHVNAFGEATRDRRVSGSIGTIIEYPTHGKVRPVGEIYYDSDTGLSILAGAIWTLRRHVIFDAAIHVSGAVELRVGLTWVIDVGT